MNWAAVWSCSAAMRHHFSLWAMSMGMPAPTKYILPRLYWALAKPRSASTVQIPIAAAYSPAVYAASALSNGPATAALFNPVPPTPVMRMAASNAVLMAVPKTCMTSSQ